MLSRPMQSQLNEHMTPAEVTKAEVIQNDIGIWRTIRNSRYRFHLHMIDSLQEKKLEKAMRARAKASGGTEVSIFSRFDHTIRRLRVTANVTIADQLSDNEALLLLSLR